MSIDIENKPYLDKFVTYNKYFEQLYNAVNSLESQEFKLMIECLKKIRKYHGKTLVDQYNLCKELSNSPSDEKYYNLSMHDDIIDICKKMIHACEKKLEETIIRYSDVTKKVQSGGEVFKPHLINFYASWCGACNQFKPVWNELEKHYKNNDMVVSAIECGDNQEIMGKYGIKHFPTVRLYMASGGNKNIYEYTEKRELDSMINWINLHVQKN